MFRRSLYKYDGRHIRLTDEFGDSYEGMATHDNEEYCEHEFGRAEEALEILGCLFYKSNIKKIELLEDHNGEYGKFTGPYGTLEEWAVEDGIDRIREVLFPDFDEVEAKEHVVRLLRCLIDYPAPLSFQSEVTEAVKELLESAEEEDVKTAAQAYLDKFEYTANGE